MPNHIIFDTEVFNNVYLAGGRVRENGNIIKIWLHDEDGLRNMMEMANSGCTFVTFNGIRFDMPVFAAVLAGRPIEVVKHIANTIIEQEMSPWRAYKQFKLKPPELDQIDLMEVSPSFVGLKTYGARMHMPWLKDLPFEHDAIITPEQIPMVEKYWVNDLDTTEELFSRLQKEIDLRITMGAEYGLDFRSKSDTQMAEAAFVKRLGIDQWAKLLVPEYIEYKMPDFIKFKSPHLIELAERIQQTKFLMNQKSGHVELPAFLGKEKITLNNGTYQLGVGGIHSTHDKKVCHVATDDWIVCDIDAASYYPTIMINCNLIPQNTGQQFIDEYRNIYHRRLEAKRSGNKAVDATLKISLNGTFGKTADRWSALYSPDLMLAITLTGQLTLLNLIEELEEVGAVALSANTDGIAMGFPVSSKGVVESVVSEFSKRSKFDFEYTYYRVLAAKDVNNYLAVKEDRKIKAKGIYAPLDLKKNPTSPICAYAVSQWLAHGTPLEETIFKADFCEFISARNVTGGGVQGEEQLGKVVRWYYTTDRSLPPLTYAKNGNKVPKTEGARACMLMPDKVTRPSDLDYEWYYKEAIRIAVDLGCSEFLTHEQIDLITPPKKERKKRVTKNG